MEAEVKWTSYRVSKPLKKFILFNVYNGKKSV